ncbi:UNVERIFIED_CONTAM: peptide deformylase [Brevibacillus sp. OAP136]
MSVKTILPFGDPILRKVAKPVIAIEAKVIKLLDDLAETLYDEEGRAGLAAPQIGILKRVVVMDCGDGLIELINPEIVEMSGQQVGPEACLSFPGYTGTVKRAKSVTVKTLNRQGETVLLHGRDYLARCMQHEIDHLNGILFIDHIEKNALYHNDTKKRANLMDAIRLSRTEWG